MTAQLGAMWAGGDPSLQGHRTPEEAALAGWDPKSKPHVLWVEHRSATFLKVAVDTEPSHPMMVDCELHDDGLWRCEGDINL